MCVTALKSLLVRAPSFVMREWATVLASINKQARQSMANLSALLFSSNLVELTYKDGLCFLLYCPSTS